MWAKSKSKTDRSWVQQWDAQRNAKGWWHSFELPDGTRIEGVFDVGALRKRITQFPIPADLHGKRVLDIGAWDGWYSFEMERRGADVMAIDNWDNPRFREVHARLGSRVDYRQMDMYDLTPDRVGRFDIVLFMGVLYHLKHPLLVLERVCALTTEMAAVESFVLQEKHRPHENMDKRVVMEFYETNEFGGQTDNWVAPSLPCLLAFCRTAGFARVELCKVVEHGAALACYRKWEPALPGSQPGPRLVDAYHNKNFGINFQSRYDEEVQAMFDWPADRLTLDEVKPDVGAYAVRPIHVARVSGDRWQANFKLPPGLTAGWHDVRIRIQDSLPSNSLRVAVDIPLPESPIRITGLCDGKTWIPNQLDKGQSDALSIWIEGLPDNADKNNLRVFLDGHRLAVTHIEPPRPEPRQVNAQIPSECPNGAHTIEVALGSQKSPAVELQILD